MKKHSPASETRKENSRQSERRPFAAQAWPRQPDLAGRLARARLVHLRRTEASWGWLSL